MKNKKNLKNILWILSFSIVLVGSLAYSIIAKKFWFSADTNPATSVLNKATLSSGDQTIDSSDIVIQLND